MLRLQIWAEYFVLREFNDWPFEDKTIIEQWMNETEIEQKQIEAGAREKERLNEKERDSKRERESKRHRDRERKQETERDRERKKEWEVTERERKNERWQKDRKRMNSAKILGWYPKVC